MAKVATNDVVFPHPKDPSKKPISIKKDTPFIIPVYALQHDERYYPDPEKFDPERFFEENKNSITKYTCMPFGEGPRICLGKSES